MTCMGQCIPTTRSWTDPSGATELRRISSRETHLIPVPRHKKIYSYSFQVSFQASCQVSFHRQKNASGQFCLFQMGLDELEARRLCALLGETAKSAGHKENWNQNYSIGYESTLATWAMQMMRSNGVSLLTYFFKCTTLGAVQLWTAHETVSGVFLALN